MKRSTKRPVTDNMGLVYMVARSFNKTTGMPMDEAIAEASYGFVKACLSYDATKGAFSTWGVFRMQRRLLRVLNERKPILENECPIPLVRDEHGEEQEKEFASDSASPESLVDFKHRLERCDTDT